MLTLAPVWHTTLLTFEGAVRLPILTQLAVTPRDICCICAFICVICCSHSCTQASWPLLVTQAESCRHRSAGKQVTILLNKWQQSVVRLLLRPDHPVAALICKVCQPLRYCADVINVIMLKRSSKNLCVVMFPVAFNGNEGSTKT